MVRRSRHLCVWPPARGLAYVALLVILAGVALLALQVAESARLTQQREAEAQLLFAGRQYRNAIERFTNRDVGALRGPPQRLEDLLEDGRGPVAQRHIRRLYPDPLSGRADWDLLRDARGGLVGVRSRSRQTPLRKTGFERQEADFARAQTYADWRFTVQPVTAATSGAVPKGGGGNAVPTGASIPSPGDGADTGGDPYP